MCKIKDEIIEQQDKQYRKTIFVDIIEQWNKTTQEKFQSESYKANCDALNQYTNF